MVNGPDERVKECRIPPREIARLRSPTLDTSLGPLVHDDQVYLLARGMPRRTACFAW
jgi:hypothetical protein